MDYDKPALTLDEQVVLLQKRGLSIDDEESAKYFLGNISYYKLSGYWFTFLKEPHTAHLFKLNTEFQKVINTYKFDRKLRILIFNQLERIENSFKTQLIYHYSLAYGSHWFDELSIYKSYSNKSKFIEILTGNTDKSKELFIEHYKNKYSNPKLPPSWMSIEICSLGQVSLLFKNLKTSKEKKIVSKFFGVDHVVLESWMESLAFVRNICAHHSRLWNRQLPIKPTIPRNPYNSWLSAVPDFDKQDRLYLILAIIFYLSKIINENTTFKQKLLELLDDYPELPKHYMGFPTNWKNDDFWRGL